MTHPATVQQHPAAQAFRPHHSGHTQRAVNEPFDPVEFTIDAGYNLFTRDQFLQLFVNDGDTREWIRSAKAGDVRELGDGRTLWCCEPEFDKCGTCKGTGIVNHTGWNVDNETCRACEGFGFLYLNGEICRTRRSA